MRIPNLAEIGLATALSGMATSGCTGHPTPDDETNTIAVSAEDCRELERATGYWWNEDVGGWRNGIRKACSQIVFEDDQSTTKK